MLKYWLCFAPDSPTTHCTPFAALAQTTAPPQRRRRVLMVPSLVGRGGPRLARAGRNGRCMLAQTAGARRTADSSIGGVHGAHATRPAAAAAALRLHRGRPLMRAPRVQDVFYAHLKRDPTPPVVPSLHVASL